MGNIPLEHGLIVATILFALGFYGVMVRRNLLFMLMSLEIMMNAAALAFVLAGSAWVQPDGRNHVYSDLNACCGRGLYWSCDRPSVLPSLPSLGCGCC